MATAERTCWVFLKDAAPIQVREFARFKATLQGETHLFAVTAEVTGVGQALTHVRSGMRVRSLGVGAAFMSTYSKLRPTSYRERGRLSLEHLIAEKGEALVRSVIASAPDLKR
ncbi:MAG TPA: hypothetical protein VFS02_22325 [Telluria sp.]|nr:hypothetical protein [Telluria sp.]